MFNKATLKRILGEVPFTAEIYWALRQHGNPPGRGFNLSRLEKWLPQLCEQARAARKANVTSRLDHMDGTEHLRFKTPGAMPKRRVLIFSTLRYWIEHAALLGISLAGLGHDVTLLYLPYSKWQKPLDRFDLRRQDAYAHHILQQAEPLLRSVSLLEVKPAAPFRGRTRLLSAHMLREIHEVSLRDAQYTLQVEDVQVDEGSSTIPGMRTTKEETAFARLYRLRLERNLQAAAAAMTWIQALEPQEKPDVLITPNGSILEMGAVYQVARELEIPTVTYEFGEQRQRIWLARNAEVMHQETDDLWEAYQSAALNEGQWEQIRALYNSRQSASLWQNFSRLWQEQPSQGGEQVRQALGLDSRPVVLLAANVIGDSLTLGRQVFSQTMTEWLEHTVQFFTRRPDTQLVVRIHPGERYAKGPSVAEVVQRVLPEIPPHIHLVQASDPINTYDLVEIADLGLVYTTTVGMEMAMSGVPVIVAGQTHYRGKGFTLDPNNWDDYDQLLERVLSTPQAYRPSREQVERSWHYAYRFFFDYPVSFPWHLLDWWKQLEAWPMERVLSDEGQQAFGDTFRYLSGEPRQWTDKGRPNE